MVSSFTQLDAVISTAFYFLSAVVCSFASVPVFLDVINSGSGCYGRTSTITKRKILLFPLLDVDPVSVRNIGER